MPNENKLTVISLCYSPSSLALDLLMNEQNDGHPRLSGSSLNKFVGTEIELAKKRVSIGARRPSYKMLEAKLSRNEPGMKAGCHDCKGDGECSKCNQHREIEV